MANGKVLTQNRSGCAEKFLSTLRPWVDEEILLEPETTFEDLFVEADIILEILKYLAPEDILHLAIFFPAIKSNIGFLKYANIGHWCRCIEVARYGEGCLDWNYDISVRPFELKAGFNR